MNLISMLGGVTGFIHVMENLEKYFCHGNVMEFCFSGKVMEMSWNFTKMSWKKYVFTNSVIERYLVYFLQQYMFNKFLRLRRNFIFFLIFLANNLSGE